MSVSLPVILILISGAPVKQSECTKPKEMKSGNSTCYLFRHYVVRVVEREEGSPPQVVYLSPRQQNATPLVECRKHSGEAVIEMENVAFECMYEKLVLLRTAQCAPGTGEVIVVDADTQRVVFRDSDGDLEVSIIDGRLIYWAAAKALENDQCEGHTVGFDCTLREKVSVDLRTKKSTRLGETVKVPVQ